MRYMRKIVSAFFLINFLLVLNPQIAQAKVVINEFSSATSSDDWVELFNSGPEIIDLSTLLVKDGTTNKVDNITGFLDSGGFFTFGWSNRLNNSGDSIRLFLKSDENNAIDQISYGIAENSTLQAPGSGYTGARSNDGENNWVILTATKGSTNNTGTVAPTSTPTPTDTPAPTSMPTKTPIPTKTPAPTKEPIPTKTPMPTKIPTSTIASSPTIKKAVLGENKLDSKKTPPSQKEQKNYPTAVLDFTEKVSPTKKKEPDQKNVQKSSFVSFAFISGGALFLAACGILAFRAYKNRRYEQADSNNQ